MKLCWLAVGVETVAAERDVEEVESGEEAMSVDP